MKIDINWNQFAQMNKYVYTRDFFFRVCYALVTRIKTFSRLKHTVFNAVLNRRFKRFNLFMRKNKGRL